MHRFLVDLDERAIVSRHPHELTIVSKGRVAKLVKAQWGSALRLHEIDGLPAWQHLHWLTPEELERFELDGDRWLLAVRNHVEGRSLREAWLNDQSARNIALRLTYRVRDLHEQGLVHGDLQPSNVIVDPSGDVWLIDTPLLETNPDEEGHVAGSAALMAPELWEGEPGTPASDVYAHACLVTWLLSGHYPHAADDLAGWASSHRTASPRLDGLPRALSGVVGRMLAAKPEDRPQLQELADALLATGSVAALPPTTAHPFELFDTDATLEQVAQGSLHLAVFAPPGAGKSRLARSLVLRTVHAGRRAVLMSGPRGASAACPAGDEPNGPWSPVRELIYAIQETTGEEVTFPAIGGGDRLFTLERLTEAVLDACAGVPLLIVWDDFDHLRPDALAWWTHFRDALDRGSADVSTIVLASEERTVAAIRRSIASPGDARWSRWRTNTLRAEVRGMPQARWEQLVTTHGSTVGGLLSALDRESDARGVQTGRREVWDSETLRSVRTGWRERVALLHDQCAFGEVIETCEGLYRSLAARGSTDVETMYDLLRAWTEATISGGGNDLAGALDTALSEHHAEPRFAVLHARLLNALGRHGDGLDILSNVIGDEPQQAAELAVWRAQLALSAGRFEDAREAAEAGMPFAPLATADVRAHLEVLYHAAPALRGEREAISALAELATRLASADAPAQLLARIHAYRAIGLGRTDSLEEATEAHLRALEQVEHGGLSAELPTYLLNVGTAYHRQGRLGLAREYYARGLRVAQSTTRASTRALLFANQANIDLALGRLGEASELVERGLEIARRSKLAAVEVMCRSVAADIELARPDALAARRAYLAILGDDSLAIPTNQRSEIHLSLAEAALQLDDAAEAGRCLDLARALIEEHNLDDLEHHLGMLRARQQWAEGGSLGTMAGIERFRRHLVSAHAAGNHRLVLRQSPFLGQQLQREGLDELLRELVDLVQDARNAVATGLGRELRRDFFAQLPEIGAPEASSAAPAAIARPASPSIPRAAASYEPFYRMLSLNEVILHARRLEDMLSEALEIASTLSGAERAFILLRDRSAGRVGSFSIARSRDVDGEPIPSPHLAVSLTIAEEAARTGRTVVTLNAREDGRFSQALSVVDLDLTSVLCVPVRDASGLLGALYLDHRFHPGIFEGEVPRMMESFGHQLALAINNARRIEELEAERSRLREAQQQLAELLAEREEELAGMERRVADLSVQVARAQSDTSLRGAFPHIAFGSRAMERVLGQVKRVARGDIPVVVTGESGVGKELIARAIHDASPRAAGPFVAFNCGAVSESLFESEMFGHIKGAFTGANFDRQGLFAAADGGTIFLDEVGEMPMAMQVKLLRVLQERQIRRLGETESRPIDMRVVAATNRDLSEMVAEELFREDLYYRLAAFVMEIPALRDRRDDIPLIATKILESLGSESGRSMRLAAAGARLLSQCDWPGNVRELENTLRTAVVLADGDELGEQQLAPLIRLRSAAARNTSPAARSTGESRGRRRKADRLDVVEAMRRAGDDRIKAAEILGVSERTLYRYLKRWDLY